MTPLYCYANFHELIPSNSFRMVENALLIVTILLISGCGLVPSRSRTQGEKLILGVFDSIENEGAGFCKVYKLEGLKIHIVSDAKYFDWPVAKTFSPRHIGYAKSNGEIYIIGKRIKGKIVVNPFVLGHEIAHVINFQNEDFANPDEYDELGF